MLILETGKQDEDEDTDMGMNYTCIKYMYPVAHGLRVQMHFDASAAISFPFIEKERTLWHMK